MMPRLKLLIGVLMLYGAPVLLPGQITWYLENFNDNTLTGWGWNPGQTTFTLTEADSILQIVYNRTDSSGEWDNFNFTPPQPVDVNMNPVISLEVRSDISTQLTLKPVYDAGGEEVYGQQQANLTSDNQWHSYSFDLVNYAEQNLERIYFYLDGGTTAPKLGQVDFDNLEISRYVLTVFGLTAQALDSTRIRLDWACNDTAAVDRYRIYRGLTSDLECNPGSLIDSTFLRSYIDSGLTTRTAYYYRAIAVDTAGFESEPSNQAMAKTFVPGAVPYIDVLPENSDSIGLYEKYEVILDLWNAEYTNPYNPDEIDISTAFTSPTGAEWQINAFYNDVDDISEWTLRFAPNEIGTWHYTLKATDPDGTGYSEEYTFEAVESNQHGWLHVADTNPRYLVHDDGASFYGNAVYYPWNITEAGLDELADNSYNLVGYWNSTYDNAGNGGGNKLIESMESGIGAYDQDKCARIEQILDWAAARNMNLMLAIWSHDDFSATVWVTDWDQNPYKFICHVDNIYSDSTAWEYQEKQYRYLIARYGHRHNLAVWEIMNEINGTDGWAHGFIEEATDWVRKVHNYLHSHDPYNRPTTVSKSGGEYWHNGYAICDLPNVHLYETGWTAQYPGNHLRSSVYTYQMIAHQLWNNFPKPGIMGEAGYTNNYGRYDPGTFEYRQLYHNAIWASWSRGLSMTPVWWTTSELSVNDMNQMDHFAQITSGIDYAHLTLEPGNISVPNCDAYILEADTFAMGWIRDVNANAVMGKTATIYDLADTTYTLDWYSTWTGELIESNARPSISDTLKAVIPIIDGFAPDAAVLISQAAEGTMPARIELEASPYQLYSQADSSSSITAYLLDAEGRFCKSSTNTIQFNLEGPGQLVGSTAIIAENGMADIEYQASSESGTAQIIATSPGLIADTVYVTITGVNDIHSDMGYVPDSYALLQNYPNPFNRSTVFTFDMPKTDLAELQLYNLQGKLIVTIISEVKPAGRHTIQWSNNHLVSGIYFYRFSAGEFSSVRKLILLK